MTAQPDETSKIIQTALEALNRGDRDTARRLAEQAAALSPGSSAPWLLLAALAGPAESLAYAEKALQIDPESKAARDAFAWALKRQGPRSTEPKTEPSRNRSVPAFVPEPPLEPLPQTMEPKPEPARERFAQAFVSEPSGEPIPQAVEAKTESSREGISLPIRPDNSQGSPIITASPARGMKEIPLSSRHFRRLVFLGGGILILIIGLIILWPQLNGLMARLLNPIPTPQCVQPMVKIGNTQWPIKSIARTTDGSIPIPAQTENVYWVEGTTINYIFELNPNVASAASLANINPGDSITITWADCTTDEFVTSTTDSQVHIDPSIFDQTHGGVSILVPTNPSTASRLIQGVRPETLTPVSAEPTDANAVQAEISFLDQTTSADGKTLTLSIAIKNTGAKAITLTGSDISLTEETTTPLAPLGVEPALPQEIAPGGTQTLILTFSKPAGKTAVFKILDFSVDIYF